MAQFEPLGLRQGILAGSFSIEGMSSEVDMSEVDGAVAGTEAETEAEVLAL